MQNINKYIIILPLLFLLVGCNENEHEGCGDDGNRNIFPCVQFTEPLSIKSDNIPSNIDTVGIVTPEINTFYVLVLGCTVLYFLNKKVTYRP